MSEVLKVSDILPKEDGTYLVERSLNGGGALSIVDYAARWAYGYIVGVKKLEFSDIRGGLLFGVWTNPEGEVEYDVVKHVAALSDAVRLGQDHNQRSIWDLREKKEVAL